MHIIITYQWKCRDEELRIFVRNKVVTTKQKQPEMGTKGKQPEQRTRKESIVDESIRGHFRWRSRWSPPPPASPYLPKPGNGTDGYVDGTIELAVVIAVVGEIHMSSMVVRPRVSTSPGVDWQRPMATLGGVQPKKKHTHIHTRAHKRACTHIHGLMVE